MIRNVVLGQLRPAPDETSASRDRAQLTDAIAGILGLQLPGLVANHGGLDAGLREGGWDFAITNDWQDPAAYRGYDTDPEHGRYRQQIAEVCGQLTRVQFEIPDAAPAT